MSDCAVFGCIPVPGASIHYLPKNPALKQKWMDFIYSQRSGRPANTVQIRICGTHFRSDCFVNFGQRSMGFAKKLILKPDAVPCIYPGSSTRLKHGAAAPFLKRADVACQANLLVLHEVGIQCNLPAIKTRTLGTQLSERYLKYRRSLGVQTKLPTTAAGNGTVEMRPSEQTKGGLASTSQKPSPSPPIDWSQPEIEDDDRCVTVVTRLLLQVFLSWRNQVLLLPQYCRDVGQRICAVKCRVD